MGDVSCAIKTPAHKTPCAPRENSICPTAESRRAAPALRSGLDALADELKLQVLMHTGPSPLSLARMQQVSCDWRRLAQDATLWAPLYPDALSPATPRGSFATPAQLGPQGRLAHYMRQSNCLQPCYLRALWQGVVTPAMYYAAAKDPIFACHAALALKPTWQQSWSADGPSMRARRRLALAHGASLLMPERAD